MANESKELIELFLTGEVGTSGEDFEVKFQRLVSTVPKRSQSTLNPEFFPYFFLGSVLTLPYAELKDKIGVKGSCAKVVSKETVKLAFKIEKSGKTRLVFKTITTVKTLKDQQCLSLGEVQDALKVLDFDKNELKDCKIEGETVHIKDGKNELKNRKVEEETVHVKGKKVDIKETEVVGELDLKELNQKINENSILPEVESKGAKFKKVKENVSGVNFDDALEKFSNVREAKQGAREFFQNLAQIYRSEKVFDQKNRQEVKLKLGLHASEAAYHGFTYGVLAMNFKYEYALDINVERIAGKGYADLMFISRYDGSQNRKWNAPPIVIELKKGRETAKDAIRQIETQGYIKNLPSMRTTAEQGIEVGVNFDLDPNGDGISVKESAKITKPKGFVELFNKFNELSEEDLKAELKTKLNHLYFSIVESNGGGENTNYLSRLILGELFADNTLEKHIFIHTEDHAKYGYRKHNTKSGRAPQDVITPKRKMISTFMFEMQDNQYVILNIIEGKDFRGKKSIPLRLKSINPNKYMQVNIKVNPEARGGFKVEDNPEESYYQDIEIGKVAGSGKKYEGEFKKIEHVKLLAMPDEAQTKNLQKALSPRLLDMPDEVQTENLQKALSPLKKLIMAESDFQAVMQGLFIAQAFDEKGKIIRVFTEPNYSSVGKPDLVVSCIEKVGGIYKELELIFMELKFLEGGNVREIFVQARRQLLRYKSNIKTFTDLEEVSGMVMIFSINKKSEEVLIIDKLNTNGQEVDGSQGEDLELQKQKMKIRVDHSSIDPDSQRTPIQDGSPDAWSPGSRSDARSSQGSIGARHESPNQLDLPESPIPQSSLDRLPLEESVYMQPGPLCYQHGFSSPKPGPSGYQRVSSPNYVLDSPQASQQGSSQSKSPISQSSSDGSLRCFSQVPTNKNTPSEKRRGSSSDESEGSSPLKNYKTVRPYQRRA